MTPTIADSLRGPGLRWWVVLGIVITIGLVANWPAATGVLILILIQVARPFDFLISFVLLAGAATFVEYTVGNLTLQLGIVSCAVMWTLVCYSISHPERILSVPMTPFTLPLTCFLALTLANAARGFIVGYSPRYIGLELLPLLGLGMALLVANVFTRARYLPWSIMGLVVIGGAAAIRGFLRFAATRAHGEGYTVAAPGLVALLLVNLALRSKTGAATVGLILLAVPLFLHQFVTFGRGLWSGCAAGLVASVLVYAGVGRGAGPRWMRSGVVLGVLMAVCLAGAIFTAYILEEEDLLLTAVTRVQATVGPQGGFETHSNLIRLGEYFFVWNLIQQSPWIGHGVGYAFTMKQAFSRDVAEQWYAHQSFLFVWLKQGLLGLGVFLWMLAAAITLGVREARRRTDPLESSWFATMAAATLFLAVLSLSNFPFGMVNEMFLLALFWGGAMGMTRTGFVRIQWKPLASASAAARSPARGARESPASG